MDLDNYNTLKDARHDVIRAAFRYVADAFNDLGELPDTAALDAAARALADKLREAEEPDVVAGAELPPSEARRIHRALVNLKRYQGGKELGLS